jgi:acyl-lipid omega-6 desaturase (Delta-12 desaturase)
VGLLKDPKHWVSTLTNSAAILVCTALLIWAVGVAPILLVQALTMLIAATIGVWLFYIQHQYEGVAWSRNGEWKVQEAAIHGSSHYDLPPVLQWLTANIGIHHVHHLSSRIPFYRLDEVMRDVPELAAVPKLKFVESLRCARLTLWDEAGQRLVTFRDARSL